MQTVILWFFFAAPAPVPQYVVPLPQPPALVPVAPVFVWPVEPRNPILRRLGR